MGPGDRLDGRPHGACAVGGAFSSCQPLWEEDACLFLGNMCLCGRDIQCVYCYLMCCTNVYNRTKMLITTSLPYTIQQSHEYKMYGHVCPTCNVNGNPFRRQGFPTEVDVITRF
jgi:hypothetical protein